ncbi:tyrosine-protein kinase receptor Tie-1-like [Orbicella faveolata]|uniref:tyrosine-protein kinase receptor Tie-1-like n=1 Tax=Orbicella faveolata TaxID=48498 RepID=UPI0009E41E9D|nr:tyrosine-protein kinase receptor Tie-1-like [Orbicella faveolata]
MATMGGIPYPTLTNSELCRLLKTGYRMERPNTCCDEVYELMCECWREDPSTRPSFSELIERLEVIMTRDVPYFDLNRHDESRPCYNVPS